MEHSHVANFFHNRFDFLFELLLGALEKRFSIQRGYYRRRCKYRRALGVEKLLVGQEGLDSGFQELAAQIEKMWELDFEEIVVTVVLQSGLIQSLLLLFSKKY